MTTATLQHKFEIAGLGVYPFQCTGMVTRVITYPTGESQPSGTCDYCGNGIKYCCVIRDANGKTFEVGTDCVMKTGDRGLVDVVKRAQREKKADERRAKREAEYNSPERVAERERYAAEQAAQEAKRKAEQATIASEQAWLIEILSAQNGDFCQSIARELTTRRFETLSPRVREIVAEIYGKQYGRRGSKAFDKAIEDFEARVYQGAVAGEIEACTVEQL